MYLYDDYVNIINCKGVPNELRGKCVRVVSISDNMDEITVIHKYKVYKINECFIEKNCKQKKES